MTANDTLPSNLTFDKILTVLRCESRSGQFRSSEHNIKEEKKKTVFYTEAVPAQHIYISQVDGFLKCSFNVTFACFMFKCNYKSDCKHDAHVLICLNRLTWQN